MILIRQLPAGTRLVALATLGVALVATVACTQQARTLDELLPIQAAVTLRVIADQQQRPEAIAAEGFDEEQLRALRRLSPSAERWRDLLAVRPAPSGDDDQQPSLDGDYTVTASAVVFRPKQRFVRGHKYLASWRGSDGEAPLLELAPERSGPEDRLKVVAVYPTADVLPVNLRRIHIEFDGTMSGLVPPDSISLVLDDTGELAPLSLADRAWRWNEKRTRLTLDLLTSAGSETASESPLSAGRRYRLLVDRSLRDARGQTLRAGIEKLFLVDAPDRKPPRPESWTIKAPTIDRAPLVVDFPSTVDLALVHEALEVRSRNGSVVAGESRVSNGEKRWTFQPKRLWREGDYVLRVATALQDPAGNAAGAAGAEQNGSAAAALPFEVKLGLMGKTIR